jgi:alkylated DNA repair protein (DNA oxidative demethylase)
MVRHPNTGDLFMPAVSDREMLAEGATLLRGFTRDDEERLVDEVNRLAGRAPFRRMVTPGGYTMSVAMTSCGAVGWVTDRTGYRYDPVDPLTGRTWPPLPDLFLDLAGRAAAAGGFPRFEPDACLMNEYVPSSKLSLHRDADERDFTHPVVSVSLGLPAVFLFGGAERSDSPRRFALASGDVLVFGGPARLNYHGIAPLADGVHPLTGRRRINMTFRNAR